VAKWRKLRPLWLPFGKRSFSSNKGPNRCGRRPSGRIESKGSLAGLNRRFSVTTHACATFWLAR